MSQGVCAGIGAGLIYVPSIAVISHYFQKRRTLAMSIVAAGSSFGSVIHPIMLNNTFNSSLGFGNSVRASAGLVTGMLLIACLLMRTRLPPPKTVAPVIPTIKKFARDKAYVFASLGSVFADRLLINSRLMIIVQFIFLHDRLLLSVVLPSVGCIKPQLKREFCLLLGMLCVFFLMLRMINSCTTARHPQLF